MRSPSLLRRSIRLYHTVKYLRAVQIYYRLYYLLRERLRRRCGFSYRFTLSANTTTLTLEPSLLVSDSVHENTFTFLNQTKCFGDGIDWNTSEYGKLWTYNLTYFDYLQQPDMQRSEGLRLIYDFIDQSNEIDDGFEPFPISLRGVNWIKFITTHKIEDCKIDDSLYAQYYILMDHLEYHLLGNHLLENGFSLLFGAYYFQDKVLHAKAEAILFEELNEQILKDGAHFELSPMYHQIMLFRLLDCINLLKNNRHDDDTDLLIFLQDKASLMLGWLQSMTFRDGMIPLFNDSANNIAPTSGALFEYAMRLNVPIKKTILQESGYRRFDAQGYECIVDVGNIGPDYIPGHAHADTLSFELHLNNHPYIVDTGVSTYETNERRTQERSTAAHNTVELHGLNQSDVWGGFRVANRAYITRLQEHHMHITAVHNGYEKRVGALHERTFAFERNRMTITDTIISDATVEAVARIHFHPDVNEEMIHRHIVLQGLSYSIDDYFYAPEFNKQIKAKVLKITFTKQLEMSVIL